MSLLCSDCAATSGLCTKCARLQEVFELRKEMMNTNEGAGTSGQLETGMDEYLVYSPDKKVAAPSQCKAQIDHQDEALLKLHIFTNPCGFVKRAPALCPVKPIYNERRQNPPLPKARGHSVGVYKAECRYPSCSIIFTNTRGRLATAKMWKHQRRDHRAWCKEISKKDSATVTWEPIVNPANAPSREKSIQPKKT
ncbi:hypothetical protein TWF506_004676 [Arthrobotrys conoides]|uniref:Uncharacterized protein n=1 Tax=Arthrobotrys conoides TaxID=74498 RepID=A0AAN8NB28_9PEZI